MMRNSIVTLLCALLSVPVIAESAAGLHWTAPAGWKSGPPQTLRAATYIVPAVAGAGAAADCVVYFFGAGQGGSVEANIERWKGQFTKPTGGAPSALVVTRTVHGMPMTTIDVEGIYSGLGGPNTPGKPAPGYRLLGAIVQGPGGNIFVKFTGPAGTVAANRTKFDQLLMSFTKN